MYGIHGIIMKINDKIIDDMHAVSVSELNLHIKRTQQREKNHQAADELIEIHYAAIHSFSHSLDTAFV